MYTREPGIERRQNLLHSQQARIAMHNVKAPHAQFGNRNSATSVIEKITSAVMTRVLSTVAASDYDFAATITLSRRSVFNGFRGH